MKVSDIQISNKVLLPEGAGHLLVTKTLEHDTEINSYYITGIDSNGFESCYYVSSPDDEVPVVE